MNITKTIALLFTLLLSNCALFAQSFQDSAWVISSVDHLIENYKGENSLYLQNGIAYLPDADFENGIIEFDMYMTERVAFAGVIFRINEQTSEQFYTRAHHSGHPDAYQYNPIFNGNPGWQLYHDLFTGNNNGLIGWRPLSDGLGYNGILNFKYDQWVHFKFLIKEQQAELYIDHAEEPAVFMKRLVIPSAAGGVGLSAGAGATHFANFTFTQSESIELKSQDAYESEIAPGTILNWELSDPVAETDLENTNSVEEIISARKWKSYEADPTGLMNISRHVTRDREKNTVIAKFEINADEDKVVPVSFGFSDRVKVFFENAPVFSGNDGFRTRDYRYLGTMGYFDTIFLNLKKGRNTVYFAVSENFGGWGVQATLPELEGLKYK